MTTDTPAEKSTRALWFEAALELLAENGIGNVTINKLSKKVGLARTSFYWHFENREELIELMIAYWVDEFTELLADIPAILENDPKQGLIEMVKAVRNQNRSRYELAMCAWAQNDKKVAEKVRQAHNRRFIIVEALLIKYGFDRGEAWYRAKLITTIFSLQQIMTFDGSEGDELSDRVCLEILFSPLASPLTEIAQNFHR